jgi:transaldolase
VRFHIKTLETYGDGETVYLLKENVEQASWVLSELSEIRIDLNEIANKLEDDGVEKFIAS